MTWWRWRASGRRRVDGAEATITATRPSKRRARHNMTDALERAGATVRRRRRLRRVGRGVHMGWSEAGTFVFRVFLVQAVLNLLGKPWSVVPASVGARSRARGRGPGQRRGCLRVHARASGALHFIFASNSGSKALRICDASQASARVSERSPSGPAGLETNVSASVPAPLKTRVLHTPVRRRLQSLPALLRRGLASTAQRAHRLLCQVTRFAPLDLSLHLHWAAAVLIMARIA